MKSIFKTAPAQRTLTRVRPALAAELVAQHRRELGAVFLHGEVERRLAVPVHRVDGIADELLPPGACCTFELARPVPCRSTEPWP